MGKKNEITLSSETQTVEIPMSVKIACTAKMDKDAESEDVEFTVDLSEFADYISQVLGELVVGCQARWRRGEPVTELADLYGKHAKTAKDPEIALVSAMVALGKLTTSEALELKRDRTKRAAWILSLS